jgi:hypothetical protein
VGWSSSADDAKVDAVISETLHRITDYTKSKGVYDEYVFLNNAHSSQNPIRSYGMNAYRKMKRVSREVDPLQMFQYQVPGGFKVRE